MKALTLWRPWSDAIVHGPKRVENRPWAPHADVVGELIAIHAGRRYDDLDGAAEWPWPGGYVPPHPSDSPTGIVGVARVVGALDTRHGRYLQRRHDRDLARLAALDRDPWWAGPVGWLLDDVVALPEPIPHPGSLGLWRVPPAKVELILDALGVPS